MNLDARRLKLIRIRSGSALETPFAKERQPKLREHPKRERYRMRSRVHLSPEKYILQ